MLLLLRAGNSCVSKYKSAILSIHSNVICKLGQLAVPWSIFLSVTSSYCLSSPKFTSVVGRSDVIQDIMFIAKILWKPILNIGRDRVRIYYGSLWSFTTYLITIWQHNTRQHKKPQPHSSCGGNKVWTLMTWWPHWANLLSAPQFPWCLTPGLVVSLTMHISPIGMEVCTVVKITEVCESNLLL